DLEILVRGIILTFLKKIEQATETGEINVNYLKILASNTDYPLRNKLKQYLKNIGMKQAELAAITNIKKGNISLIVNNHVQPSLEAFFKIWAALQYPPIEELFYRDKE
ncbi:helix-turn-helix transcriptional regulator, partial [Acinetobacter baumannii]|nr:helix-turn-helix transcriptional regulator [Acinetobacter baumannii]